MLAAATGERFELHEFVLWNLFLVPTRATAFPKGLLISGRLLAAIAHSSNDRPLTIDPTGRIQFRFPPASEGGGHRVGPRADDVPFSDYPLSERGAAHALPVVDTVALARIGHHEPGTHLLPGEVTRRIRGRGHDCCSDSPNAAEPNESLALAAKRGREDFNPRRPWSLDLSLLRRLEERLVVCELEFRMLLT
jgi:hypothetical protein